MKRSSAKKFIVYSTIIMLFGSDFYAWIGGVMIQAFYPLIFVNLLLLLLLRRLWVPIQLLYIFAGLAATCCIGLIQGTDTVPLFAKQAVGIMISLIYFCSFFRMIDFDLAWVFREYARVAFYVVVYGLVSFPFMAYFYGEARLRSILSEPSTFAMTCLPAFYYQVHMFQQKRTGGYKVALFAIAYLLAGSSNGFLALLFGVIIFSRRYKMGMLVAVPIVLMAATSTYVLSNDFETRFDDTVSSVANQDVRDVNLSSLALYLNFFVTQEVLKQHPFFGNGLGSHGMSYDKYASNLSGTDRLVDTPMERINADDANSLLLRTLSDMGIVGAGVMLFAIWYFRPKGRDEVSYMCEGILLYFFLKLLRGGHYFSNEQYFFVLIYFLRPYYLRMQRAGASSPAVIEATPRAFQFAPTV